MLKNALVSNWHRSGSLAPAWFRQARPTPLGGPSNRVHRYLSFDRYCGYGCRLIDGSHAIRLPSMYPGHQRLVRCTVLGSSRRQDTQRRSSAGPSGRAQGGISRRWCPPGRQPLKGSARRARPGTLALPADAQVPWRCSEGRFRTEAP